MKNKPHYAWKILFACCCLSGAVAGMVVHCRGIFYAPAAQTLGVSPTTYATYATVSGLVGVCAMPLIRRLFARFPIKRVLMAYLAMFCGSVAAQGLAQSMWQCYAIASVQGLVSSFLTLYPIAYLLKNWFSEKRGLATGIATMFAGIFASIMNLVLSRVIDAVGWRGAYLLVGGAAFLIAAVPTLLYVVRTPAELGLEPYGGLRQQASAVKPVEKARISRQLVLQFLPVAVVTAVFYMSSGYNQHLPNYARSLGMTASVGASLVSVCMIGNVGGKLIGGLLNDAIGVYRTSLITILSMAAAFFVLVLRPENVLPLYAAALLLGQATAFIVVQIPLLLGKLFDRAPEYEACLGIVMMVGSLTSAANNALISVLYRLTQSYRIGHALSCACMLLSAALILVLWRRDRRQKKSLPVS